MLFFIIKVYFKFFLFSLSFRMIGFSKKRSYTRILNINFEKISWKWAKDIEKLQIKYEFHRTGVTVLTRLSLSLYYDQPDYEQEWLKKTSENESRAVERGQQALEKLHSDLMQSENERNLHILHRFEHRTFPNSRIQRFPT